MSIGDGDPGRLLSAMLEGEQAEECHACHIFVRGKDPDDATFLVRMIFFQIKHHAFLLTEH
jgi:hypothetical protein